MNNLLIEVWGEDRLLDEEGQRTESLTGEESAEESENTAESLENDSLIDNSLIEETSAVSEVQQQEAGEDFLSSGTAEEETESTTEAATEVSDWWKIWENDSIPVMWAAAGGILAVLLIALGVFAFLRAKRRKKEMVQREQPPIPRKMEEPKIEQPSTESGFVGKVHNIGDRKDQQDSFGITSFAGGQFIVVADGMGGLSGGDKISQRIVMTMLQDAAGLRGTPYDRVLFELVAHANREVNKMIGVSDRYVSGSTVVAAIVEKGCFHWVSVGDSRIYLYRNKRLIQLNREHTYEAELLIQAVNGEVSFEEAKTHPKRGGLTSFIGMGELKYVDGSRRGVKIQEGDRLLLMSDGVFHTLSEEEMQQIIETSGCAEHAAKVMQERILSYQKTKQDNFTAVIIDL